MKTHPDDVIIKTNGRGEPLLIVFDASAGGTMEHDNLELWDRFASYDSRPCGLVLLRDANQASFYRGVGGLGDTVDETVGSLRSTIVRLEATQVMTCGVALGGHAALVYGALLGASRIVAFDPVAHLIADELERYNDRRWRRVLAALPDPTVAHRFDALDVLVRSRFAGEAILLVGTGRGNEMSQAAHLNLVHAQWLARSERVVICPFPDVWQDLWEELRRRGSLADVLRHYLFGEFVPPRGASNRPMLGGGSRAKLRPVGATLVRDRADMGSGTIEVIYAVAGNGEPAVVRPIDDEMRRWIAENILIGQAPESIAARMKTIGVAEQTALDEIRAVAEHPYVTAALRLQNRLAKRDWLLAALSKLARQRSGSEQVARHRRMSRHDFFHDFYTLNCPVIIEGMIDEWPARRHWSLDDFETRFGDRIVQIEVHLNESDNDATFRASATQRVTVGEYVRMIREAGRNGDFSMNTDDSDNLQTVEGLFDDIDPIAEYLDCPGRVTGTFGLDPAGAVAPFRHELENCFLALVMGRLRLKIVRSWDLPLMRNSWQNRSERDGRTMSAQPSNPRDQPPFLECELSPGDLLFLPVGCWFYIETIEVAAAVTLRRFVFDNDFGAPAISRGVM